MDLKSLGFDIFFEKHFSKLENKNLQPARIINEQKQRYKVISKDGEFYAEISGKFQYNSKLKADYPAVGDWVSIEKQNEDSVIIHDLLPRKTFFQRNVASSNKRLSGGVTESQVLASNIDIVFIVVGLDNNFNVRRIERYLTQVWDSGARPIIILNKSDLCDDLEDKVMQIEQITSQTPILTISATNDKSLEQVKEYLKFGESIVLLGSSGVGKSTIINTILGYDRQKTSEISDAIKKGTHTTTSRELIILETGGILIDTPGIKELQLWADEESLSNNFKDIERLISKCKFTNCQHDTEPGCAILKAIENDNLDIDRWKSYLDIKKEISNLKTRKIKSHVQEKKESDKKLSKMIREHKKLKNQNLL
jgi:ribosome biogenesis GTPase